MKKSIITFVFALFVVSAFSQTVSVQNGKAVETVPKQDVELTPEQMIIKRDQLANRVLEIQTQLADLQKELTAVQAKLANYQDICNQLGYK